MPAANALQTVFVPINREGYPFLAIAVVVLLVGSWIAGWLFWPLAIVTAWVAYFFRDPRRVTPVREGLVVSPGRRPRDPDRQRAAAAGAGALPTRALLRVSVFMNVFDCHVNRAPVSGRIARSPITPGKFLNADLDKASDDNERNGFVIETASGPLRRGADRRAGGAADRRAGHARARPVAVGERFGMIRFGSRVDVYLPEGVRPLVGLGQKAVAGETVLADARRRPAAAHPSRWLTGRAGLGCDMHAVSPLRAGAPHEPRPAGFKPCRSG